jgi:hypothetical protein
MIRTAPFLQVRPRRLGLALEAAFLVGLLAVTLPTRLVNLDAFVGKFDEGIRGEQLLLMAAGFRPFRDIFASQGPLSLDVFFPTFVLFGQTLAAARLAPAILSIVGIAATAWAARLVAGPSAAIAAAAILAISPTYLKNSRLALVEVPALAPAVAAVGAALAYQHGGDRRWLVASAVLFAVALLVKPMVAPALVPIGLAILLRGRGWLRGGLLFGGVAALVAAAAIAAIGPADVYDQLVRFRMASRQVEGWSPRENWGAMAGELVDEQLALYAAAGAAAILLLALRPKAGLPLVAWPLASFALLMVYSPLQFKHAVIMLPPLALLVGGGVGLWFQVTGIGARVGERSSRLALVALVVGGAIALWYAASLPAIARLDQRVIQALPENRPDTYDDEIALLTALTGPDEFVLVDEPSVAFAARRLVPPRLVDTSMVRIRSRSLDAGEVIASAEGYDVRAMMLFSDGLRSLRRFAEWVDAEYVAIKINERRNGKDRALYLSRDADLGPARAALEGALQRRAAASFAGEMRLLGHSLERSEVRPGGAISVTVGWEALGPVSADYHVVTLLRDPSGQVVEQNERGLGGGGQGTAAWEPGRWVFRAGSLDIPPRATPGEYEVAVGLYDSRAKRMVPLDGSSATDSPLATVQVRG